MSDHLWNKYLATVTPLFGKKPQDACGETLPFNITKSTINTVPFFVPICAKPAEPPEVLPPAPAFKKPEKNMASHMRAGKFYSDCVLDLHGYSQDKAYDSLYHFIKENYHKQVRHLLIISGKGRFCYQNYENKGILHKKLPEWFKDSIFSDYISVFQKAAKKDGDDGAYYVILRQWSK